MTGSHFDERGHLNEEGVALYVDALKLERTDHLPAQLRAHVAGCQECRVHVTGLYSLLADEPISRSHPTLGSKAGAWTIPAAAYRTAAVIVTVVGILAAYRFLGRETRPIQQPPEAAVALPATDSTPFPTPAAGRRTNHGEIAANFKPYEELEGLVGSELRGESFEVTSPEELSSRERVSFGWKTAERGPWKLIVLDNGGKTVKECEVPSVPFVLEGPFKPGLYYWKVIRNDELAHVGKFRVE
jgi:hypothetical protein